MDTGAVKMGWEQHEMSKRRHNANPGQGTPKLLNRAQLVTVPGHCSEEPRLRGGKFEFLPQLFDEDTQVVRVIGVGFAPELMVLYVSSSGSNAP